MRDYQFGNFIYTLRLEKKLSQSELGVLVGVSNKAVSKWENGVSKPSFGALRKLAEIFDVSMEELLAGKRFFEDGAKESGRSETSRLDEPDDAPVADFPADLSAAVSPPDEPIKKPVSRKRKILTLAVVILAVAIAVLLASVSVYHIYLFNLPPEDPTENTDPPTSPPPAQKTDLATIKKSVVKVETNLGTGSGFCAIKKDWIITNYHVIENSNKIYVIADDESKEEISRIVFYDEEKDIAVLQAKKEFTPIDLGDGKSLALQDSITVIGSPQGVLNTVSVGIISNVAFEDYIVISAPISPGSSGGVLLNDQFQAIGIITATANNEFAQNLNFAINIEELKKAEGSYKSGEYPSPAYPLKPNGNTGGGQDPDPPKDEIPRFMAQSRIEYIKSERLFRIYLSVTGTHGNSMAADVELALVLTNANGEVVYDQKISVPAADFLADPTNAGQKMAPVDLPVTVIAQGSAATGQAVISLIYKGEELDSARRSIERGLPIKAEPFETLVYTGNGVGSVSGVDLPWGTYHIIFTHEGNETFEVEFNGKTIVRNTSWGKTSYVYQLRPDEDMNGEGTPLKNIVFSIVSAVGPWTMTIERTDVPEEGRNYVDGLTYTGNGVGYVKDISLPLGTYNIIFTHEGSQLFEVELNNRNIVRKTVIGGKIAYVYQLKPNEEMFGEGTSILDAVFNITDADGPWAMTIERADMSEEDKIYEDGVTYTGNGVGFVKDIYLPLGTYNITITHTGGEIFDIELDGRSILRKKGPVSYVYTLRPEDEELYGGTPMPCAYFNITEADGDWSITVRRAD